MTHKSYPSYGGRGITICSEWFDTGSSEAFVEWGLANGFEFGLEVDRRDTNGNYSPDNCHFTTRKLNARNLRYHVYGEWKGVQMKAVEALELFCPNYTRKQRNLMNRRLLVNWSLEDAIITPPYGTRQKNNE